MRNFDPEDFLTYQLPFAYDPRAEAPTFQKFLEKVLPDKSRQLVLAEFLGYLFTPGYISMKSLLTSIPPARVGCSS